MRESQHRQSSQSRWSGQFSRRTFLRGSRSAALAASGLLLVGCGGGSKKSNQASSPLAPTSGAARTATATAAAVKRGGTLTLATASDATTLDPLIATSATTHRLYFYPLYDALLSFGEGDLKPNLASFTIDGNKLRLSLRDKVMFHDGTPLDAAAVKFHIERILNPDTNSRERANFASVQSATVIDPLTVELVTQGTNVPAVLMPSLAGQGGMVSSPTAVQKLGKDYSFKPVGTGPFTLESFAVNDRTVLRKNPNYWKAGDDRSPLPYLDKIVVRFIPESSTSLTELRSGGVDVVNNLGDPKNVQLLKGESQVKVVKTPATNTYFIGMDMAGPTANQAVRQAIEYAIDRDGMNQGIFDGVGATAPSFIVPSHWAFDPSAKSYTYDLNKAKDLMKQANVSSLDVRLLTTNKTPDLTISEAAKAQLAKIGINVTITSVPVGQWVQQAKACNTDLSVGVIIEPVYEPYSRLAPLLKRDGGGNWTCYDNQKVSSALETALITKDAAERKRLYSGVMNTVADDAAYVWLPQLSTFMGQRSNVNNLVFDAEGALDMTAAWLSPR